MAGQMMQGHAERRGSLEAELLDGTPVLIRPITPDDRDRLKEGLTRVSAESRMLRFGRHVKDLTEDELRYLTDIDYVNHMAWVALERGVPRPRGLGVARYVRRSDDPRRAEAAVVVVDSHQRLGLGTLLLTLLGKSALEHGIETFLAYVVVENRRMLKTLKELGAKVWLEGAGLVGVEVPVPKASCDFPNTPAGRVFKQVAEGAARGGS